MIGRLKDWNATTLGKELRAGIRLILVGVTLRKLVRCRQFLATEARRRKINFTAKRPRPLVVDKPSSFTLTGRKWKILLIGAEELLVRARGRLIRKSKRRSKNCPLPLLMELAYGQSLEKWRAPSLDKVPAMSSTLITSLGLRMITVRQVKLLWRMTIRGIIALLFLRGALCRQKRTPWLNTRRVMNTLKPRKHERQD